MSGLGEGIESGAVSRVLGGRGELRGELLLVAVATHCGLGLRLFPRVQARVRRHLPQHRRRLRLSEHVELAR